ncbi:MAG: apolipoprotein N-acyltransferase [Pseudonocardiales bacterium]|nr:apolipoprotein N-acyltransferase [Pseudonocardiales bacterium]
MKRRLALAALAGLIGVLAFPPFGWWPLAFLSIGGFTVAVAGECARRGALLGLAFGAGLFLPMLHWTATYVGSVPWIVLVFSQTWYTALLGVFAPKLLGRRFGPVWIAAGWVAEEALRDRAPFGGFPWGRWAFSQSESPLKWFAALGGAPLLTFTVALIGSLLGAAAIRPGLLRSTTRLAVAALIVLLGAALWVPLHAGKPARTTTVAAIQGDVPDRGLEFNARRRQVLDNHVAQTLVLAAQIKAGTVPRPELVLWPENASDIDPTTNVDAAQQIQRAVDAVGVPILVGALLDGPGNTHVTNAGIVWMPSTSAQPGPGQRYVKRHPVPFGEYIPLRSIARAISKKVDLVGRDMVAGRGNGLLTQTPYPVGDVICFEVAYDSLVRSSVNAGAQLLVVQTNNATFGHSAETYQQLAMSQLRAVENGRTVVQVATSGKSAIIDADGHIVAASGALFTADVLVRTVALRTSTTLATRVGATPEWLLTAFAVYGALAGVMPWLRRRTGRGEVMEPTAPVRQEHGAQPAMEKRNG